MRAWEKGQRKKYCVRRWIPFRSPGSRRTLWSTLKPECYVTTEQVPVDLNSDFSTKGLSAQEIQSIVSAWQAGAISRDTMTDLFRRGEVLPEGRTTEEEEKLIGQDAKPAAAKPQGAVVNGQN